MGLLQQYFFLLPAQIDREPFPGPVRGQDRHQGEFQAGREKLGNRGAQAIIPGGAGQLFADPGKGRQPFFHRGVFADNSLQVPGRRGGISLFSHDPCPFS